MRVKSECLRGFEQCWVGNGSSPSSPPVSTLCTVKWSHNSHVLMRLFFIPDATKDSEISISSLLCPFLNFVLFFHS